MTHPVERRLSQRRQSVEEHGIVSIRVRPGVDASIVDVSATGVLVETERRLLPGTSIEIHFERDKRLAAVRGRVLRCAVVRLGPSSVRYRGAVLFDRHLSWLVDDHARGYPVLTGEKPTRTPQSGRDYSGGVVKADY